MPQDGENVFFRGGKRGLQTRAAKLQLRVALKKMPGNAGAQSYGALEALRHRSRHGRLLRSPLRSQRAPPRRPAMCGSRTSSTRQSSSRVNSRTISEPETRRGFPVNMARAVGGNVIAQRVQILAAPFVQAFQRSLQSRQNLEEIPRRLDRRIHERFGSQLNAPRLLQKAKREARDDAESVLPVHAAARESDRHALLHALAFRQIRKVNRRFEQRGGRRFFRLTASTRRENDGSVSFSFSSSTCARTVWPAKMCSGKSRRISTPSSVIEERMPDIRMMAIRLARIRNSRLLPVLSAASATTMMPPM